MTESLAAAITVGALVAGVVLAVRAAAGRYRWHAWVPALLVLEVALLALAALDVAGLLRGHRPAEPGTHLAYLLTSLGVLPVAGARAAGDDGRWAGALLALALLAVAVIVVRLTATGRPGHA